MLSLVRSCFQGLFLRLEGEDAIHEMNEVFRLSRSTSQQIPTETGEDETVIIISIKGNPHGSLRFFRTEAFPGDILAFLLNSPHRDQVLKVKILPRTILFRVTRDYRFTINEIRRDFCAEEGHRSNLLWWAHPARVTIAFTQRNLNHPISPSDLMDDVLYINMPYEKLLLKLRNRALEYFNEALGGTDWNAFEIRIFDAYERYNLHAERLRSVIDDLELGLVLGEGWGKDYARILMPVKVYRFRLFSFLSPDRIKKTLMGLEFDAQGNRLVDLDLYQDKQKVAWQALGREMDLSHAETGRTCRINLLQELSPQAALHLQHCEERLSNAHDTKC